MKDNIKIEINYMLRCHVLEVGVRRFNSTWEPSGISVLSLDSIETFAGKIVALLNRTAPRDLYDIHNLLKCDLFRDGEKALLRKCVAFYSAICSEMPTVDAKLVNLDRLTQMRIKTDLYPVLRMKDTFNLHEVRTEVKACLTVMLQLEEEEKEFLELFRNKEYRPELLFRSNEILERVKEHPMALWKCSDRDQNM